VSKKKSTPMSWSTALFQRLFDRVIKHHTLTFSTSLVAASTIAGALLMWAVVPPTAQIGRPTLHVSETTQRVRLQSMLDSVKNRDKTSHERLRDAAEAMVYFMMPPAPPPPPPAH
jgi:hypothetical protein